MIRRVITAVALLATVAGCATSTAPGAVGVNRSQLMMVSSAMINAQAAEGFSKLTATAASAGKLNSDVAMTARVKDISKRIIAQAKVFRPDAASWDWQVNVIDSDQVNASCMPGGKIVVYSGLIKKLDLTDAELAAVLGHEVAHALREHSREKVSQKVLSDAVVQGLAASRSRYAPVHASLAQVGSLLFVQLPYSREMETEADLMGLELMARAGYDPKLASNVWVKMQKLEGGSGRLEFLATHPNHENRIAALESTVPKVAPLYASVAVPSSAGASQMAAAAPVPNVAAAASPAMNSRAVQVSVEATALVAGLTATTPRRVGQSSYEIERMGREKRCDAGARAWLVSQEPGIEHYTYQCNAQETWTLKCEYRQCSISR